METSFWYEIFPSLYIPILGGNVLVIPGKTTAFVNTKLDSILTLILAIS